MDSPLTQSMDDLNSKLDKEKQANVSLRQDKSSLQQQVDELKRQLNRKEVELGRKDTELSRKDVELSSLKQKVINSPQASSNGRPRPEPKVRWVAGST